MKVQLKFESPAKFTTAMLAVFSADSSTNKAKNAAAKPILLTRDAVFAKADKPALEGGEFSAGRCETLLLHGTPELQAKRLLIVGLGKAAKATVDDVRRGAGAAVRFAKRAGSGSWRSCCRSTTGWTWRRRLGLLLRVRSSETSTPTPIDPTARTAPSSN
jgi:hypothetical protein